jgi:transcriptional regulator with XRE-family HTH domain
MVEPVGYVWRGRASRLTYELKSIREAYGLSASAMGRVLGYTGPKANVAVHIRRLERDARPIPPSVTKLALMYARYGIPKEWCA